MLVPVQSQDLPFPESTETVPQNDQLTKTLLHGLCVWLGDLEPLITADVSGSEAQSVRSIVRAAVGKARKYCQHVRVLTTEATTFDLEQTLGACYENLDPSTVRACSAFWCVTTLLPLPQVHCHTHHEKKTLRKAHLVEVCIRVLRAPCCLGLLHVAQGRLICIQQLKGTGEQHHHTPNLSSVKGWELVWGVETHTQQTAWL